jgi:hypothetical protein
VATQTQIDVPTISITTTFSETATTYTTSTSTATVTIAPPACSITGYKLQIIGGSYDGFYMTDGNPTDPSRVAYSYVYAAPGLASAHVWTAGAGNRFYEYPKAFALSAFGSTNSFSSLLSASDARVVTEHLRYLSCVIQPSTAVASVPGATGLFSCSRPDGTASTFFTVSCASRLPSGIYEGTDVTTTNAALGCSGIALTIAAIPVFDTNC